MAFEALGRGVLPRVQWGPVIAGVMCAIAVQIVLGLFGVALGFGGATAARGIVAGVWTIAIVPILASFIGAWVAVRITGHVVGAFLQGAMVWCIGLIAGALFLAGTMTAAGMPMGAAVSGNAFSVMKEGVAGEQELRSVGGSAAGAGVGALLGLGGALFGAVIARRSLGREGRPGTMVEREFGSEEAPLYGQRGNVPESHPEEHGPGLHH